MVFEYIIYIKKKKERMKRSACAAQLKTHIIRGKSYKILLKILLLKEYSTRILCAYKNLFYHDKYTIIV